MNMTILKKTEGAKSEDTDYKLPDSYIIDLNISFPCPSCGQIVPETVSNVQAGLANMIVDLLDMTISMKYEKVLEKKELLKQWSHGIACPKCGAYITFHNANRKKDKMKY